MHSQYHLYDNSKCIKIVQKMHLIMFIILIGFSTFTGCDDTQDFQKNIPVRVIWAVEHSDIELPCDVSAPAPNDAAKLILWFKDSTGIPLYSLDSRNGGPLKAATHSALASDLGQRVFFAIEDNPKDARLQIRKVKPDDGGVYRCRVDFFNSATRNIRVNLTLVVPPDEPRIFDAQGKEISHIAGPFREGYELFLSCQVTGGHPIPNVSWWMDDVEIPGSTHPSVDEGLSALVNQLLISTVTRELFGSKLECRAQGTPLIEPVVKKVTIQVHLKPLQVKIVSSNDLLIAGKSVPLRCESWGSYPPAKIIWLLDGEIIRNADITTHNSGNQSSSDSNITISILNLKLSAENDGGELICKASNPWFSGGALEDKRIISVAYPPTVSVHLANEDPSRVVTRSEQDNVTLKCRADAKPPVTSYSWFKNGMRMSGENTETLYLIQLERESAGLYSCGAQNREGETRSSTLTLKVQFAPRCKPGTEQTSLPAINMQSMNVTCQVDADPPESIRFSWTFNHTGNVSPIANSRVTSEGLGSSVDHLPPTNSDFVTFACWATNSVGRQLIPCLIHILPAKIPEPPKSCELRNDTTLIIVCEPGFDGGLTQYFLLEVIGGNLIYGTEITGTMSNEVTVDISMNDQATTAPVRSFNESQPVFKLEDLEPGREYQFLVYAVNAKGKSEPPIIMTGKSYFVSDTYGPRDDTILSEDPTPAETSNQDKYKQQSTMVILAAVVAAGAVIVTSIIVTGIVVVCKHRPKPPEPQEVRKRMRPARTDVPSMYAEEDEYSNEFSRPADIRCSRAASTNRTSKYITEGFVQYSQPSLNVYITDPDLILPRGDIIEFTTIDSGKGSSIGYATTTTSGGEGGGGGGH